MEAKFHTVVNRRVTDEETVSVESWHDDVFAQKTDMDLVLCALKDWRDKHNAAVVNVHNEMIEKRDARIAMQSDRLSTLDAEILDKQGELARLDEKIARRVKRVG